MKKQLEGERSGNRTYQDTLFRFMFSDKKSAIELYNALEGTNYGMDTDVEFTTLENVLYVEGKNDLGFSIDGKYVVLTEHQSTINNNMPARFLEYVAQTYKRNLSNDDFFKRKAIPLLTPEFFVIYTGEEQWHKAELKLSDSYLGEIPANSLDLVVKIIDVRYNKKEVEHILSRSEKLRGYSLLLEYVRKYKQEGYTLKTAIDVAVNRCVEENILRNFLIQYGKEVRGMLYDDITIERFAEIRAKEESEEAYARGHEEGAAKTLQKVNHLNELLLKDNRIDDMKRAATDSDFQQKLFAEYKL